MQSSINLSTVLHHTPENANFIFNPREKKRRLEVVRAGSLYLSVSLPDSLQPSPTQPVMTVPAQERDGLTPSSPAEDVVRTSLSLCVCVCVESNGCLSNGCRPPPSKSENSVYARVCAVRDRWFTPCSFDAIDSVDGTARRRPHHPMLCVCGVCGVQRWW